MHDGISSGIKEAGGQSPDSDSSAKQEGTAEWPPVHRFSVFLKIARLLSTSAIRRRSQKVKDLTRESREFDPSLEKGRQLMSKSHWSITSLDLSFTGASKVQRM